MEDIDSDVPEVLSIPHSPTTEEALLGALIVDPQRLHDLAIEAEDFYIIRNRFIFQAIDYLARIGRQVDYVTLCGRLDEVKLLADIGGPAEIIRIMANCGATYNAPSYAQVLQEKARRRRLIYAAEDLAKAAYSGVSNIGEAVSQAMLVLSHSITANKGVRPIAETVSRVFDEVDAAIKNPCEVYGISTGILDWDNETHGLQNGTVVKLSGEPGIGKSLLACQVLAHAAEHGHPGALYEFEMSGAQVVRRLLSAEAKVTTHAMRSGRMTEAEINLFAGAVEKLSNYPVYMCTDEMTTQELRADLHRAKDQHGIELAVIDYEALLMDLPDADETARSMALSSRVHSIAKAIDIPLIVIDDMTKEGIKGKEKSKAALAGSARKLHDADEIIIMRTSAENKDIVLLTWEKNREGANLGIVPLLKSRKYPHFGNMTKRDDKQPAERRDYLLDA